MQLQIVTTNRQVLDCQVEEVYAPGILGQIGILPEHTTFLTVLDPGELRYRQNGRDHFLAVSGGVADVVRDVVTILADSAEPADEINVDRARNAEKNATSALAAALADTPEHEAARQALARARARLVAAGRVR